MYIGLIRHFPVEYGLPSGWITAAELYEWQKHYNRSEACIGEFDLGDVSWQACISSDLYRAKVTAKTVFKGDIEYTSLLREFRFEQFKTGRLKLPAGAWRRLYQLSWMMGYRSQRAYRDDFKCRVLEITDHLKGIRKDTLVVSHAGMLSYLSKELRKCGFSGPSLGIADTARTYIFKKNNGPV